MSWAEVAVVGIAAGWVAYGSAVLWRWFESEMRARAEARRAAELSKAEADAADRAFERYLQRETKIGQLMLARERAGKDAAK